MVHLAAVEAVQSIAFHNGFVRFFWDVFSLIRLWVCYIIEYTISRRWGQRGEHVLQFSFERIRRGFYSQVFVFSECNFALLSNQIAHPASHFKLQLMCFTSADSIWYPFSYVANELFNSYMEMNESISNDQRSHSRLLLTSSGCSMFRSKLNLP